MRVSTKRHSNDLNHAFPGNALALLRFLKKKNKQGKRIPKWRVRQLDNFVATLNTTALELERARLEGRMATIAWASRNFLELSIWVKYCCASEENAKRFAEDTSRDLFGMIAATKGHVLNPDLHKRLDELLQRFERIFNTPSFKVTDEFKRVSNAAKELGLERQFYTDNKFFSKMAHPTAFIVNSRRVKLFDRRFQAAVFIRGVGLALESMVALINFFMAHYPDPNLKRKANTSRP